MSDPNGVRGGHDVETLRLFVAINIPPALRDRLHAGAAPWRDALGGVVAWSRPDKLHVTLRFLGAQRRAVVDRLAAELRAAAAPLAPAELRCAEAGAFPSLERARVLWIGIAANARLARLYQVIDAACDAAGFGREPRAFHPHVTLGRVRPGARPDADVVRTAAAQVRLELRFPLHSVDLMASHLAPSGARYTCLAALPLVGGRPVHGAAVAEAR